MTSMRFEGDLQDLSDKQSQYIRDSLNKRGYKNNKVVFAPVGQLGDNFAANVKRITVEVENGDNFQMVAKIAPKTFAVIKYTEVMFNNETVMYGEVLPTFEKLQEAANVPEDDKLRYAQCYGCYTEKQHQVILLQDLKPLDYTMLDKYQSLPNKAVRLILKNFAIYHSLSYALKKSNPDVYDYYKNKLLDLWSTTTEVPEHDAVIKQLEDNLLAVFENAENKYKDALQGALKKISVIGKQLNAIDANSKYSVIQQGDAWTNNIMFKLEDNEIKDCIMIDYQISKVANPVCDILYMIFNCTDYVTRSKHFYEWIDYYHDQLDKALSNYGMQANLIYPRDQLDADLKRYAEMFFGTALIVIGMIFRKSEEAALIKDAYKDSDLIKVGKKTSITLLSSDTLSFIKTRVQGLIDSCIEFGFI
ncbi:unnamed protein product [Diatraea saccharalis]|uniref:CHK kinase-like domain-containing protein n=1 Tax=Diatraea saccharalis TaxID=40085 RepID=A0A9N9QSW0_9NEOP|nr:unnamed protein product [Diatraea saccharalis]